MTRKTDRGGKRGGFTLIELLVVIAIIAVLLAMLVPAVMRTLVGGANTQARGDIDALGTAHGAFRQRYGVTWIPSRIRLVESGAYDMSDPIQKRTVLYLQQLFPRFNPLTTPQDWNNNGSISSTPVELLGEECLVFFLGGIPSRTGPNTCLGFSGDNLNPAETTTTTGRRGPEFEFKTARLFRESNGFFSYRDPYQKGKSYVYLSAARSGNDYSADSRQGVQPFIQAAGRFINPNGFQIVTAGRDGVFGTGGSAWSPTAGYGTSSVGADDIANFSRAQLGTGQE